MRIVELKIDQFDDISGFDAVALVGQPAHEADFFAFTNQDIEDAIAFQVIKTAFFEEFVEKIPGESTEDYLGRCIPQLISEGYDQDQATAICYETMDVDVELEGVSEEFSHYEDLPIATQEKLLERLREVGISQEKLEAEGFVEISEEEFLKQQEFALPTRSDAKPDLPTNETKGGYKILFKYQVKAGEGPSIKENSRDFCIDLINMNLLFRKEDIDRLTIKGANSEEFGYYDIFKYKGSFNCRHEWKPVYIKMKEDVLTTNPNLNIQNILKNLGVGVGSIEENTKPSNLRGNNPIVSFSKENFSFQEDKKLIIGPLMLPNKLIFRVDENNEPYYVYFSDETIAQIAKKMMKNKLLDKVNMEHDPSTPVEGYMVESWLVEDPNQDKQNIYGFNYPKGTWMGMYKIENDEDWAKIKNGEVKGFSIEGFFADRLIQN